MYLGGQTCVFLCVCECVSLSLPFAFSVVASLGDVDIMDFSERQGWPYSTSQILSCYFNINPTHLLPFPSPSHLHSAIYYEIIKTFSLLVHSLSRPNLFTEPGISPCAPYLIGFLTAISSSASLLSVEPTSRLSLPLPLHFVQLPLELCPPYSLCLKDILQITFGLPQIERERKRCMLGNHHGCSQRNLGVCEWAGPPGSKSSL